MMKYLTGCLLLLLVSGVAVAGDGWPPIDGEPKPESCNLEPKYCEKDPVGG